MTTNKTPWYRSKIVKGFVFIAFLPFALTYYILKQKKWQPKQKAQYIASVWVVTFVLVGVSELLQSTQPPTPNTTPTARTTVVSEQQPQTETNPSAPEMPSSSFERINAIVTDKTGVTPEVYSGDEFGNESNAPYEVFVNLPFDHSISSCSMAKSLSVDVLKSLYTDDVVRPDLTRVIVSIPYYLRVSLGATDGVPMAKNNAFNGPTVYWNTLEQLGLGENETGSLENRTWGVLLDRCSE